MIIGHYPLWFVIAVWYLERSRKYSIETKLHENVVQSMLSYVKTLELFLADANVQTDAKRGNKLQRYIANSVLRWAAEQVHAYNVLKDFGADYVVVVDK
jgi:hypothetical protein